MSASMRDVAACVLVVLLTAGVDSKTLKSTEPTITVSGISAGAFMAVQHHVVFSKRVAGSGVIAGGPFWCSNDKIAIALSSCMTSPELISVDELVAITHSTALSGFIDPPSNLKNDKVWLFSGLNDTVVDSGVVSKALRYYSLLGVENIRMVHTVQAEHSMPTIGWGNPCTFKGEPYINDCGYDAAGEILRYLYNSSSPSAPAFKPPVPPNSSNIFKFSQRQFYQDSDVKDPFDGASNGLSEFGFAYVPQQCTYMGQRLMSGPLHENPRPHHTDANESCRVHVSYHGCLQNFDKINSSYIEHAGYNPWAEANNLVILYPQTRASIVNPKGCWDWWGYTGPAFASNIGIQLTAVNKMVRRLFDAEDRQ